MTFDLRTAQFLGFYALPVFLLGMVLLLFFVAILWALYTRWRATLGSRSATHRVRVVQWFLGSVFAVGAALLFFEMAEASIASEEMARFDTALAQALGQNVSSSTVALFGAITHLGDTLTLTVLGLCVAAVLLTRGQRQLAVFWAVALLGNASVNTLLKNLYERARPSLEFVRALPLYPMAEGWSFPSGHSSGAVVAYGALAYILIRTVPRQWHLPVLQLATAIAFSVVCSRVVLQVHWASDVVGGSIFGLLWLAVCIRVVEWFRQFHSRCHD